MDHTADCDGELTLKALKHGSHHTADCDGIHLIETSYMYVLHICRIICYVTLLTYLFTDNIADRHLKVFLK